MVGHDTEITRRRSRVYPCDVAGEDGAQVYHVREPDPKQLERAVVPLRFRVPGEAGNSARFPGTIRDSNRDWRLQQCLTASCLHRVQMRCHASGPHLTVLAAPPEGRCCKAASSKD